MIKTLRENNGSYARTGNPEVQPVEDVATWRRGGDEYVTPVVVTSREQVTIVDQTLDDMPQRVLEPEVVLQPTRGRRRNCVVPNHPLDLQAGDLSGRRQQELVLSPRRLEPYERLTGISHERPEIISLFSFNPLFDGHSTPKPGAPARGQLTDAGRYVDLQFQARRLKHATRMRLLRDLAAADPSLKTELDKKRAAFAAGMEALQDNATFLLEVIGAIERFKAQLDLRDPIHTVDAQQVIREYGAGTAQSEEAARSSALLDSAKRYIPHSYTPLDLLVRLGYRSPAVREKFSSTKIWVQLAAELKRVLEGHSLEFIDVDPGSYRRDDSPTTLHRHSTRLFGLRRDVQSVPPLSEVSVITPQQVPGAVGVLARAWNSLYERTTFKTPEAQIGALANLVSREFRYSQGLASPATRDALSEYFGYAVTAGDNVGLLDAVVGRFGDSATDIPAEQQRSLAGIAALRPAANVGVLTFESKYVETRSGDATPGGAYYADDVVRDAASGLDVSRLAGLAAIMERAHKGLSRVMSGLNVLGADGDGQLQARAQSTAAAANPVNLAMNLVRRIVDEATGATVQSIANDNMGAVYAYAHRNHKVRAALFLFTLSRIMRTYHISMPMTGDRIINLPDNTPMSDALIGSIVDALEAGVPRTVTGNQLVANKRFHTVGGSFPTMSREVVSASLKSGTAVTRLVEAAMREVLAAFTSGEKAMVNGRSRFNAYLDTVLMMIVFDMIVAMIARYNNQTIISASSGHNQYTRGVVTFNIARTNANHRAAVVDLKTRLEREMALVQQLTYVFLNSLRRLSASALGLANHLGSDQGAKRYAALERAVADSTLMPMLMHKQQAYLVGATVQDIVDRLRRSGDAPLDADNDGDLDADDALAVLDGSVFAGRLRSAIFSAFSTPEFGGALGQNKRIMTVGIPLGFARRLHQRIDARTRSRSPFLDKQADIISLAVYKVDLQNSDIIYVPQRFLFELSRFPVRNERHYLPLRGTPTLMEVIGSIPTRDFGERAGVNREPTYWPPRGREGVRKSFDSTYNFLTGAQRNEIARNHVLSFLCECYVKALTGVDLADHVFDIVDPPPPVDGEVIRLVAERYVASSTAQPAPTISANRTTRGGVMFSTTSAPPPRGQPSARVVDRRSGRADGRRPIASHRSAPAVDHGLRAIGGAARAVTPLADASAVGRRIIRPKQFDRVLNVMVDPDDFRIDYDKTVRTPQGKDVLQQLINRGDVLPAVGAAPYRFRDRDRARGDMAFEKYFVTVETFGEESV